MAMSVVPAQSFLAAARDAPEYNLQKSYISAKMGQSSMQLCLSSSCFISAWFCGVTLRTLTSIIITVSVYSPAKKFDVIVVVICFQFHLSGAPWIIYVMYLFIQTITKDKGIGERKPMWFHGMMFLSVWIALTSP